MFAQRVKSFTTAEAEGRVPPLTKLLPPRSSLFFKKEVLGSQQRAKRGVRSFFGSRAAKLSFAKRGGRWGGPCTINSSCGAAPHSSFSPRLAKLSFAARERINCAGYAELLPRTPPSFCAKRKLFLKAGVARVGGRASFQYIYIFICIYS